MLWVNSINWSEWIQITPPVRHGPFQETIPLSLIVLQLKTHKQWPIKLLNSHSSTSTYPRLQCKQHLSHNSLLDEIDEYWNAWQSLWIETRASRNSWWADRCQVNASGVTPFGLPGAWPSPASITTTAVAHTHTHTHTHTQTGYLCMFD